ncbi:hypothetical protein A2Z22_00740 [Candidatus Woesebacteria bacterium RBG_16_34_12]|uniref:HNH nuclease domain-containing protein n=1 Tax=Candidatus Woesebacteria bacterium RBG_16_34_12 TaxID=1802480 RepID=A0A1F7X8D1_9BACT|nr:MAG: hypothetical protein A2Z22_00740 [Candidatus Woesebacteria bacterium RBG_16_34_12]
MVTVQKYINNQHKYKVDETYQRPPDAWSTEDKQCFIDTILRGEPIPVFFLNYNSNEEVFYIVDGQQRLNAIKNFYNNKIKLNKKFSGKENQGKTFNAENVITDQQRDSFLNYKLNFHIMEDYDDERVRLIFSRLQRGKPLQLGERLNAKPGEIVQRMREIAEHPFFQKSIGVYKGRYGVYPDAIRILFYEKFGAKQMGSDELYNFFDNNKDLDKNDKDFKNALSVLNFLSKCFPTEPGEYHYLEKHAWVLAVYTMVRDLRVGYSLVDKEKVIRTFIEDFHGKVYSEDFRNSNVNYQRFYDNVRGGWSEKIITIRRNILIKEFLKKHEIEELDEKRQISEEDKIAAFEKNSSCELCGYSSFKDFRGAEYHHKIRYIEGGKSRLENISVLCSKCHDRIHGKEKIELPSEDEITDNNE